MIPIIRQELSRCLKLKCSDIRILENVSRHKLNKTIYGKSFRITPIRFSQSKTNNDKTDSFTYKPGMSPADFKNSGPGPKKPWYKQMSGAKGQMGSSIVLFVSFGGVLLATISSYTWNSSRVLTYFERPETKLPRKLPLSIRFKDRKEDYYVRFDLMLLIESVFKDLDISERKRKNMDIYTADSLKVEAHGSTNTNFATMLGIPYFFEWNSVEDVSLADIRHKWKNLIVTAFTNNSFTLENLNLSDEELNDLKETFVLSNKAKKFAIAQRLVEMERLGDWMLFTLVPPSFTVMWNLLAVHCNDIFQLFERPIIVRFALYSVLTAIVVGCWYFIYMQHVNQMSQEIDEKVQLLGRDYLEGGYEYYVKEMRRGLLLRKGFGKEGDTHFTETGELKRLFYEPEVTDTPNALLNERIKPFKQLLN